MLMWTGQVTFSLDVQNSFRLRCFRAWKTFSDLRKNFRFTACTTAKAERNTMIGCVGIRPSLPITCRTYHISLFHVLHVLFCNWCLKHGRLTRTSRMLRNRSMCALVVLRLEAERQSTWQAQNWGEKNAVTSKILRKLEDILKKTPKTTQTMSSLIKTTCSHSETWAILANKLDKYKGINTERFKYCYRFYYLYYQCSFAYFTCFCK